ncbi:MAG: bifunctional precorrin-2 dehydrogenase/sirohydrochlorin ferrochelatase [Alphaproteobacteria bacterium]|nr:bifunctional precorrin-2 dehydrogenase/sirohydrochlorin ferrochelatase [Rhodospirillaceae bacterium]MBT6203546.1 bifunctional precorrin-2 dehydrogenase/sirohydrochlorin ferrochelatase [Rhodospirillaceae bacterium]MBT6513119.1 bifunctional precorrin-2 dehydrogenase/sirohydrochlorin ferrochelatase [Rhodospirillaceae bacterium]MBT7647818.1 bifunctional precorrin-2 dehydrogenase/sirohydrochlorin ferrochelatase [Rhodospirillaceae bacterium]MDG2482575.1 bifunctional precorrin-2 dehydrogenase/siroh
MLPLQLDTNRLSFVIVGRGPAAARKVKTLQAAGARDLTVFSDHPGDTLFSAAGNDLVLHLPSNAELASAHLVISAGLDEAEERELAERCRALRVLVNIEDRAELCDIHLPAVLRRGDLTLAISTNGRAPGLAGMLRRHLERLFGPEWEGRIDEVARARAGWRDGGADMASVKQRLNRFVEQRRWLT